MKVFVEETQGRRKQLDSNGEFAAIEAAADTLVNYDFATELHSYFDALKALSTHPEPHPAGRDEIETAVGELAELILRQSCDFANDEEEEMNIDYNIYGESVVLHITA